MNLGGDLYVEIDGLCDMRIGGDDAIREKSWFAEISHNGGELFSSSLFNLLFLFYLAS